MKLNILKMDQSMAMPHLKLLEINIISARDLPAVSKTLRTFAAVFIDPGHKLTTRVDQRGGNNPTWNYKVAFQVDDHFLKSKSSAINIQIYNLTSLRDLPIATARLLINNLSPTLTIDSSQRRLQLQISTPSGHLQGTLILGLQLLHINNNNNNNAFIPSTEISISTTLTDHHEQYQEADEDHEDKTDLLQCVDRGLMVVTRPGSEHETENNYTSTYTYSNSLFSAMPSDVASDMKKWLYSSQGDDFGSSIFENWTEASVIKSEKHAAKSGNPRRDDAIPLKKGDDINSGYHEKVSSEKKSLFSCIGNAYGFEFSFICGSNKWKHKKKKKKQNFKLIGLPEENLRRFYV